LPAPGEYPESVRRRDIRRTRGVSLHQASFFCSVAVHPRRLPTRHASLLTASGLPTRDWRSRTCPRPRTTHCGRRCLSLDGGFWNIKRQDL